MPGRDKGHKAERSKNERIMKREEEGEGKKERERRWRKRRKREEGRGEKKGRTMGEGRGRIRKWREDGGVEEEEELPLNSAGA